MAGSPRTPLADRSLREFFATEAAGGIVLLVAAVVAIVWANSPARSSYEALWRTGDLRHWVNDGLMAVFFLVVGLEIKRELVHGELHTWPRAATPAVAALGGMVVPALLYTVVNARGPGAHGWGIPMATDIAFALGVAALLGPRVPNGLKLFLLTLAIVDDIGAIVVIAVFYSSDVRLLALLGALGLLAVLAVVQRSRFAWWPLQVALAVLVWAAMYESGVHATIAGVAIGLLAPATPRTERLELALHPFSGLLIVPIFALANAGVVLDAGALRAGGAGAVVAGVALGLVVGKVVGVTMGAWVAVRLGFGALPEGVTWRLLLGGAALAGIGFTVSLFVTDLAFADEQLQAAAKIGILGASLAASVLGAGLLVRAGPRGTTT